MTQFPFKAAEKKITTLGVILPALKCLLNFFLDLVNIRDNTDRRAEARKLKEEEELSLAG